MVELEVGDASFCEGKKTRVPGKKSDNYFGSGSKFASGIRRQDRRVPFNLVVFDASRSK